MRSFLGLPFHAADVFVGMIGIANRPGGFNQGVVDFLEPFLATCAGIVQAYKNERLRKTAEETTSSKRTENQSNCENVIDAIITINSRGIVQTFNPAAKRIFGYTASEVIGKNVNTIIPEPHRGLHDGYVQKYLETGKTR